MLGGGVWIALWSLVTYTTAVSFFKGLVKL